MKRPAGLLVCCIAICLNAYAQEILFKIQYKPGYSYHEHVDQRSQTISKYEGTEDFMNKLIARGVSNPTVSGNRQKIEIVTRTGKQHGNRFPIEIEFVKTKSKDGGQAIPDGTKIFGNCLTGEVPTFDSISSTDLSSEFRNAVLRDFQASVSKISFPDKKLSVGEEFTKKSAFSIPVDGQDPLQMTVTSTYTLLKVERNTAIFEIRQVYATDSSELHRSASARGTGTGRLEYDLKNDFYREFEMSTKMNLDFSMDDFRLFTNSTNVFFQKISISKN